MSLSFLGDIHGHWWALEDAIIRAKQLGCVALVQVGDFGLFLHRNNTQLQEILERLDFPVYFIDGNHDDCTRWTQFKDLTPTPVKGFHKLFYVPRGTVAELAGIKIAFLGGAASIDRDYRKRSGIHWDAREDINAEEAARLNTAGTVDMFVTHCPPNSVVLAHFDTKSKLMFGVSEDWQDENMLIVENIWHRLGRPLNISGHMHRSVVSGDDYQILDINELTVYSVEDFRPALEPNE